MQRPPASVPPPIPPAQQPAAPTVPPQIQSLGEEINSYRAKEIESSSENSIFCNFNVFIYLCIFHFVLEDIQVASGQQPPAPVALREKKERERESNRNVYSQSMFGPFDTWLSYVLVAFCKASIVGSIVGPLKLYMFKGVEQWSEYVP